MCNVAIFYYMFYVVCYCVFLLCRRNKQQQRQENVGFSPKPIGVYTLYNTVYYMREQERMRWIFKCRHFIISNAVYITNCLFLLHESFCHMQKNEMQRERERSGYACFKSRFFSKYFNV